jgi:hypothetical protein
MFPKSCVGAVLLYVLPVLASAQDARIALAIVYDTSGSMKESVRDGSGRPSPKYVVANRALDAVVNRLQAFQAKQSAGAGKGIRAGLFIFEGNGAKEAVKFGPFDPEALHGWAKSFTNPNGPTPLGAAVEAAGHALLATDAEARHVLVITDGINTAGPDPATVIVGLNKAAERKNAGLFFHFIAFDVNANVFAPIKKQGATVVAAANEKQLNDQLEFLLEEKILLEKEEPKK